MEELEDPEIPLAAMVSVLFVILAFFMSITTLDVIRFTTAINLPEARDAIKDKTIKGWAVIDVWWTPGRGGECVYEEKNYKDPEMLVPLLTRKVSNLGLNTAYVRAAKDTQYFYISRLVKAVAEAGVPNVTFATAKADEPGQRR